MTEKDTIWNRFIDEICDRDVATLSPVQKKAVLCFWYDTEMQNGGHSGYLDCYPETNPEELEDAILTVGNKELADNYRRAINDGEEDDPDPEEMLYEADPEEWMEAYDELSSIYEDALNEKKGLLFTF